MAETGGVAGEQLRTLIERIERLEADKEALTSDIRDIYTQAKAAGFAVKVVRQLVRLRKMDKEERDEQEALLEVYRRAIGMDG